MMPLKEPRQKPDRAPDSAISGMALPKYPEGRLAPVAACATVSRREKG